MIHEYKKSMFFNRFRARQENPAKKTGFFLTGLWFPGENYVFLTWFGARTKKTLGTELLTGSGPGRRDARSETQLGSRD